MSALITSPIHFSAVTFVVSLIFCFAARTSQGSEIAQIAKTELENQSAAFDAKLDEIRSPITTLIGNYVRALGNERDRQRAAGNLQGVDLIDQEIKHVEADTPLEEMPDPSAVPEIARLRGIFVEQRQQLDASILPAKIQIYSAHIRELEGIVAVFTRASQLAEARSLQEQVDALRKKMDGWTHEMKITENLKSADDSGMIQVDGITSSGVRTFRIGIHEVSWLEWRKVREWATRNGYDLEGVGQGLSNVHPVTHVSWHDALKWCNAWSEMAGLQPVYEANDKVYRQGVVLEPNFNSRANGYRLPTAEEWRHAATGGRKSKSFSFSGGNRLDEVAWNKSNSGNAPNPVGSKKANELGIFDMTGNVWEWVWGKASIKDNRLMLGGSFVDTAADSGVHLRYRKVETRRDSHVGLRVVRNGSN